MNEIITRLILPAGYRYLVPFALLSWGTVLPSAAVGQSVTLVDFWTEHFTLPNGTTAGSSASWTTQYTGPGQASQRFAVYNNEFRVNNITVNGVGTWTSASINIAGKSRVKITVDLRSGVTGNGSLDDDNSDHYDYIAVYYKINSGAEQLLWQKRGPVNNNSAISTTVTKDSLTGSTLQLIIRARATATDEFYFFDNVRIAGVDQTPVDADASVNSVLTCTTTSVVLSGQSSAAGATYSWTGLNGFSATGQQVATSLPGLYTLTVTGAGGATATDNVTVVQDIAAPTATAFATDRLTCFTNSVTITGNSATPGVTYSWSGPGGFHANTPSSPVTVAGAYTLKVTNPANGCVSTAVANVLQNITKPNISVSNTGPLTCSVFDAEIQGASTTAGIDYSWTGPDGFASTSPTELVFTPGDYILTVLDLNNGCSSTATTTIVQDLSECQRTNASRKK